MSNSNISATTPHQPTDSVDLKKIFRQGVLFMLIGLALYVILYAAADQLVYRYAKRNRFFMVNTAPLREYDYVFLGASHAVVFDYEDMNARLEQMTGLKILNLSAVGSGVVVNRLMLDYFLVNHQTKNVVYFVDSFAFYKEEWNEKRFQDVRLFDRAPFDSSLFVILFQNPASRWLSWDYVSGFAKINNVDRFKPDITEDEATKFGKTYRPVAQIDKQRIEYLYPAEVNPADFQRYLGEFENMIQLLKHHNIRLTVIKPPIPTRFYKLLPNEAEFDQALKNILDRYGIAFYDFSLVSNDEKFFFNPDHLNRDGVLNFYDKNLKQPLTR